MRSLALRMVICSLTVFLSSCGSVIDKDVGEVAIGSRAPGFSLKSLDGATITSHSLEGNVVVLNFWATWCGPCAAELPDLKQVAASSGAKVVGIALDEGGMDTVGPFVKRHGIGEIKNFTVLLGDQDLFQRFNGLGIPYTILLDRAQRVVKIYRGPITIDGLEQDLKAIK